MLPGRSQCVRSIAACVAMAFALTCGCSNKKESKKTEDDPAPPLKAVVGLSAIPAKASAVIALDVKALAQSPVVARGLERMFSRDPGLEAALTKVLADCSLDLEKDVDNATIALIPTADGQSDSLLVAKGRFQEGKIVACLGKSLGEVSGGRLETAEFEGRPIYHQVGGEGPGLWFSFGSGSTVLVSSGRSSLEASLGSGPKLAGSKDGVARYLGRADLEANLWAIGSIEPSIGAGLVGATGGQVKAPKAVVASADLSDGLELSAQLEMVDEEDAKTLILQAKGQIAAASLVLQIDSLGPLVQKAELLAEGTWAKLRWKLSKEELHDLMGANLSGIGSSIDKEGANDENPAPKSETERETQDGN